MALETEQLLFESDITANVDVSDALDAIKKLNDSISDLSSSIKTAFANVDGLVADIGATIGGLGKSAQKSYSEIELIENLVRSLMDRFSREIKGITAQEPGTFAIADTIKKSIAEVDSQFQGLGINIRDHMETIEKVIDSYSETIALAVGKRGLGAEEVVKAWLWAFNELVGHSIVGDLIDGMEEYLVDRMRKILAEHADLVEKNLVDPADTSTKKLIDIYSRVIDELEKEQKRLMTGLVEQARTTEQIIDDLTRATQRGAITAVGARKPGLFDWVAREARNIKDQVVAVWSEIQLSLRDELDRNKKLFGLWASEQRAAIRDSFKATDLYNELISPLIWQLTKLSIVIPQKFREERENLKEQITLIADDIKVGLVGAMKGIPGILKSKVVAAATSALDALPVGTVIRMTQVARAIQGASSTLFAAAKDVGDRTANAFVTGFKFISDRLGPVFDTVKDAAEPVIQKMADVGKNAADSLVKSMKDNIDAAVPVVQKAAVDFAKKTGDALLDQLKYTMGGVADILTFKGELERARRARGRAEELEMPKTFQRMHDQIIQSGHDIETYADQIQYGMRIADISTRKAVANMVDSFGNLFKGGLRFRDAMAGVSTSIGQVGRSVGLFTVKSASLDDRMEKTMSRLDRMLGGYKDRTQQIDSGMSRLGGTIDELAQVVKYQQGVFVKLHDRQRRELEMEAGALMTLTNIYDDFQVKVVEAGRGASVSFDPIIKQAVEAEAALVELGKVPEVTTSKLYEEAAALTQYLQAVGEYAELARVSMEKTDIATAARKAAADAAMDATMQAQAKEAERSAKKAEDAYTAYGQVVAGATEKLVELGYAQDALGDHTAGIKIAEDRLAALGNEIGQATQKTKGNFASISDSIDTMTDAFPKRLQLLNRAGEDFVTNMKHFFTDFRATGKVSTQRMEDMRNALEHYVFQVEEARKQQLYLIPGLKKWADQGRQNVLTMTEQFLLMTQRAQALKNVQEKLAATGKKVAGAFMSIGKAAISHLPFIGKHAKVARDEMEKLQQASVGASGIFRGISFSLSNLSPVFQDLSMGAGQMGSAFGDAMNSMRAVAATNVPAITKSLTLLKLGAAAVIAVFGAMIIGAGKAAADVTTLGITMKVVAENVGYGAEAAEYWRDKLREANITTKAATEVMIQFMRARLPMEWSDPIQKATFNLEDLANAAKSMAVAVGVDSSETLLRFIDFIQTGNSQLLNEIGIMKNANQMYEEYAKAIGKSVKALSVRQQQEALISGLMREATSVQGVYEEAMKSAGKQLGSMRRLVEDLVYEWGKHFEPIIALVIFRLNQLLEFLAEIPESTKKTVTSFVAVATALSSVALAFTVVGPKVLSFLGALKPLIGLLTGKFGILLTILGAVAGVIGKAFMGIGTEEEGVAGLVDRLNTLLESFGGLAGIFQPVIDWLRSFGKMVKDHIIVILEKLEGLFLRLKERIKAYAAAHPELLGLWERLKTVAKDLFTVIWFVVDKVLGAVEALLDQDWDRFRSNIQDIAKLILAWVVEYVTYFVAEAYKWGKNLIESFAKGIIDWAKRIIPQVLTAVGNLIARFLASFSPPAEGPLSQIANWGRNLFETFLSAFRMADFDILDRALDLISRRINILVDDAKAAAGEISTAMMRIREAIAGAIFQARMGGGALDLSNLQSIIVGTLEVYAADIAAVIEAMFAALQAQEAYQALQEAIESARRARQEAIEAAQDVLDSINDQIEAIDDEMEAIQEQIEAQYQAALKAAGIVIDERLMNELQRQLEEANLEVQRAQRRIERIRSEMGKYGVNILTWEEINAQAQLELAQARQEQVQEQIDIQEQLQREADRIREQIEAQYEAQIKALEAERKALEDRAEMQQDYIEELRKRDEQMSRAEQAQLDAAQRRAEELQAAADLQQKLLEQRLKMEEDMAKAREAQNEAQNDLLDAINGITEKLEEAIEKIPEFKIPVFSDIMEKILGKIGLAFEGGLPGIVDAIREKISEWWDKFLQTPVGKFLEGIDIEGVFESLGLLFQNFWDSFVAILDALVKLDEAISGATGASILEWVVYWAGEALAILSECLQMVIDLAAAIAGIGTGLLTGDWSGAEEAILKFLGDASSLVGQIMSWFGITGQELLDTFEYIRGIPQRIGEAFTELGDTLGKTLSELWTIITHPWEVIKEYLIGNSLIPDLIDGIVNLFLGLPDRLLGLAADLFSAAETLGKNIFDGIKDKVDEIADNIGQWLSDVATNVANTAKEFAEKALTVAREIYQAFQDKILGPDGLISKIGGWILDVCKAIIDPQILTDFWNAGWELAKSMIEALKSGIAFFAQGIGGTIKGIWNNNLRPGFQGIVDSVGKAINDIINVVNTAAAFIGYSGWPFPIPTLEIPQLPSLDMGGIVVEDIIAKLHAGEVVLPLSELRSFLSGVDIQQKPAFAPTMIFQGGASPQQIVPAVSDAYDMYTNWLSRG